MESYRRKVQSFLMAKIIDLGAVKVQFSVFSSLVQPFDGTNISCHTSINWKPVFLELRDDGHFERVDQMVSTLQVCCSSGCGFAVESLEQLDININKFKPIKGSTYLPRPTIFVNNRFLLSIQNKDEKFFAYSVLASLNPLSAHNKQDSCPYRKKMGEFNLDNVAFFLSATIRISWSKHRKTI